MTTALYRRYRPETFAEMIGQSQVTDPLMTALRGDRIGHAYLFSGPRGCGKTTSARILARCLNCAEGPTDTPCGVCPSCIELSRAGGGSLDVVEIDAASHNGVDDARDLRERATFAPSRDRFKIFILDEAHMVTPQGFNALLKLVEEPPAHVKFIFATTEPEKVLGTIRSRTHHYPFRLVPPAAMLEYVEKLCAEEGVQVADGVLALVVRAGGGSPRDTLSLLDQLIAGSEAGNVTYERAVALLGYTHAALLDEIVDALAAGDAASAFPAVDRIVQTGQDPRRFVDDLLERLRDLIVIEAVGEGASAVLRGLPADELQRMHAQARAFGALRLSRTADLVSQALDDMTGATSPRLHLELMVARVLAGAAGDGEQAAAPASSGAVPQRPAAPTVPTSATGAAAAPSAAAPASAPAVPAMPTTSDATLNAPASAPAPSAEPAPSVAAAAGPTAPAPAPAAETPAAETPTAETPTAVPSGPVTFERIRDSWAGVLKRLESISRSSWLMVTAIQPLGYDVDSEVLTLGFSSPSDVSRFKGATPGKGTSDHLRTAIEQELGITVKYRPAPLPPADGASTGVGGPDGSGGPGGSTGPAGPGSSGGSGGTGGAAPSNRAPSNSAQSNSASAAQNGAAQSRTAPIAPSAGDDAPAAGWAKPTDVSETSGPGVPKGMSRQASEPSAATARPSNAAVTEWAVAPIPSSDAPVAAAPAEASPQTPAVPAPGIASGASTTSTPSAASAATVSAPAPAGPADGASTAVAPVAAKPAQHSAPQQPNPQQQAQQQPYDDQPPYDEYPPFDDEPPYDPMYDGPPPRETPGRQASGPARASAPQAAAPRAVAAPASAGPAAPAESGALPTAPTAASAVASGQAAAPPAASTPTASRATGPAASRPAHDGVERRGEAVIRQVLGAKFLREEPFEAPTRFN